VEGKKENETIFSDDPVAVAKEWEWQGAAWLHIVDLDGAFTGKLVNLPIIQKIIQQIQIPVQLGGGIRDLQTIDYLLHQGVERVILGTAAIANPELIRRACDKYGARVLAGIDAKDGYVAVKGWTETTKVSAAKLVREMSTIGVKGIIYTDIGCDGKMSGPNFNSITEILHITQVPVIASGGVSQIGDLKQLKELEPQGLAGIIIGKALYTGAFTLTDALAILSGGEE